MYTEWDLARGRVRGLTNKLSYERMLQVTFGGLIGSTRFKILEGRNIGNVSYRRCGARDSWERCKSCYQIEIPTCTMDKLWVEEMDSIMNALCTPNPALNVEFIAEGGAMKSWKRPKAIPG